MLRKYTDQVPVQHLQLLPQCVSAMLQPERANGFVTRDAFHGEAQRHDSHIRAQGVVLGLCRCEPLRTTDQRVQLGQRVACRPLHGLLQPGNLYGSLYLAIVHQFQVIEIDAGQGTFGRPDLTWMAQRLAHDIAPVFNPTFNERLFCLRQLL